jgi:L-lysine exporter family protein LysE/ArgO
MGGFIGYIFLGLSLSAPIGPINAAQLDRGIRNGFWNAWLIGIGALAADIVLMLLVYLGVIHFLSTPFMKTFLWLFGCFVLLYTGVDSIRGAQLAAADYRRTDESYAKSFLSGFFMSLSNPLSILFWLGIYGSILAEAAATLHIHELILYSSAIILGIFLWDLTMATIASSSRKILTPRVISIISSISGLSLIGFGVYFGVEAFKVLFS